MLVYNRPQKPIEGPSYTCEEYGLFLKHELFVGAIFFGFPMILFGVIYALVLNLNSDFKDKLFRRSIARPRSVSNTNMSNRFVVILRNEKFMSLHLKFLVILFHAMFWIMHHTINFISAFVKQEILGNQINNAASLSFGNMVALTSPLILKAFGEKLKNRPFMRMSSPEEQEMRMRNSSQNMRRTTSNILDIMPRNNEVSTQGAASKRISKSFESLVPRPTSLNLHNDTILKSKKRVSVLAIKSLILLPTDVAVEEGTPSASTG